jgi:ribonuclease-3
VNNHELQQKIGYHFKDPKLLKTALSHSSYINENKIQDGMNNERLEFLGDAIFDAIISDFLYIHLSQSEEGELTKKRAAIVRESSLAESAAKIELGQYLNLGKGEENTGGRNRRSILADAMEALIGAVYLDGGFEQAKELVLRLLHKIVEDAIQGELYTDYKTVIQEKLQSNGDASISYIVESEEGPDHAKTFHVRLIAGGGVMGKGSGKNKKAAEQDAAKDALKALEMK